MANIKSQIKRNRQNDKRRLRNRASRGTARIAVRTARTAIDSSAPESKAALVAAISALDKAAEKGVLHKNNAARRKGRLMKAFAKMGPVEAVAAPAEPLVEAEPAKKAAAPRRRAAKAEPKAEAKAEKAPAKKAPAAASAKKTTTTTKKKTAAKPSPKGKKG